MEYLLNWGANGATQSAPTARVDANLWTLKPEEVPPILFTPDDVARTLSLGRHKVYDLLRTGELRSIKLGHSRRVTAKALMAYVDSLDRGEVA